MKRKNLGEINEKHQNAWFKTCGTTSIFFLSLNRFIHYGKVDVWYGGLQKAVASNLTKRNTGLHFMVYNCLSQ